MWTLVNGPIPDGLFVLHRCDRPLCVRPEHLYLGSAQDNSANLRAPGRAGGAALPPHRKLSEEDLAEVRSTYVKGRHPNMKEIAAAFGVSIPMIHYIVTRKWWKATWQRKPSRRMAAHRA
jgi:hypothetical protein